MIWWTGSGLLGLIIPAAFGTGGYFLFRNFLTVDEIGVGVGILVSAPVLWWLAGLMDNDEEESGGSLYFVPLRGWAVVTAIIGLILTVANVIHAIRL